MWSGWTDKLALTGLHSVRYLMRRAPIESMIRQAVVERVIYSPSNYWLVLVGDMLAAGAFLLYGVRLFGGSVVGAGVSVAVGFIAWGVVEYAVHRWLLHGPSSIARRTHAQHHVDGAALISAPAFLSMAVASALCAFLMLFLRAGTAVLVVSGLYAGYNYYALLHHLLHHRRAMLVSVPGLTRLERAHRTHHKRFVVNYGVSTTWCDRLFGTYDASAADQDLRCFVGGSAQSRVTTSTPLASSTRHVDAVQLGTGRITRRLVG